VTRCNRRSWVLFIFTTMFGTNPDFYPTPKGLCEKLCAPFVREHHGRVYSALGDRIVLEPSAGKGDICDYLCSFDHNHRQATKEKIYCIEKDMSLQYILQGKGYKVIDSDFLQHKPSYDIDLIIANPPFSSGADHFLKMWEILEGGEIHCILNAETVRNQCTEKRQLIGRIIEQYGTVEYLKDEFLDAERKAAVEIAIVRVTKEKPEKGKFTFDFTEEPAPVSMDDLSIESPSGGMCQVSIIESLVRAYGIAKENYVKLSEAESRMQFYGSHLTYNKGIIDIYRDSRGYNDFLDTFKMQAWQTILKKLNIEKYFTSRVAKEFSENKKQLGFMELTEENIKTVVNMLIQNREEIMKNCIVDVFDMFTKYHDCNRMLTEKERWKTNKMWFANKKIILPNWVQWSGYSFNTGYYHDENYRDVDKVMAYLSGLDYDKIKTVNQALIDQFHQISKGLSSSMFCESEFFNVKFFKKGTVHLQFKDEALWARFNQTASDGKNWLGGDA
jgi:hypothetical protein